MSSSTKGGNIFSVPTRKSTNSLNLGQSNSSSGPSTINDLIAGGIAGSAGVFVGHPFDTIKVRAQVTSCSATTSFSTNGLFRGIGAPLATASIINALVFYSYSVSRNTWETYFIDSYLPEKGKEGHFNSDQKMEFFKAVLCGNIAGFVSSTITCPVDNIKCQQQMLKNNTNHLTVLETAQRLLRSPGGGFGFYRGFTSTCLRQCPSFAIYFALYDNIKGKMEKGYKFLINDETNNSELSRIIISIFSGGIAGTFSWAAVYPIDVVKTRIQSSPPSSSPHRIHVIMRSIVKENGLAGLYRGVGITLLRAFPVNAAIFSVYEYSLGFLHTRKY